MSRLLARPARGNPRWRAAQPAASGGPRLNITERVLAPCAKRDFETQELDVDLGSLLLNLLLFRTVVLRSDRLGELPAAIDAFGLHGFRDLLQSGALRFYASRIVPAYIEPIPRKPGDGTTFSTFVQDVPPRPCLYRWTTVTTAVPNENRSYLAILDDVPQLRRNKPRNKLADEIERNIVSVPTDHGSASHEQTVADLVRQDAGFKRAVVDVTAQLSGATIDIAQLDLRSHEEDEGYFVDSNLTTRFGLAPQLAHSAIGNALLSLARFNARLEEMKLCSAISGTRVDEAVFMESKLDFLNCEIDPAPRTRVCADLSKFSIFPTLKPHSRAVRSTWTDSSRCARRPSAKRFGRGCAASTT